MSEWLRRAGHGRAPDGSIVTWTLAEGRRGRRWREVVEAGEGTGIRSSLLLELDPVGRFSHMELATPAGLLTLHPEGDGTLHGNVVTSGGVRHVVGLPWNEAAAVLVEGSVACLAAVLRRDDEDEVGCLWVRADLSLEPGSVRLTRTPVDPDGLPLLADGRVWGLERED